MQSKPKSSLLIAMLLLGTVVSASAQELEVAKLDSADGPVEVRLNGQNDFKPITVGASFKILDTVRTTRNARAGILFETGVLLRIAPGTVLTFQGSDIGKPLTVETGKAFFFSREPKEFPVINTPAVTTAVRGTEFVIEADSKKTLVSVIGGEVECKNKFGAVRLTKGDNALTEIGKAPIKSLLVNPEDAVQWALYYPDVISTAAKKNEPWSSALESAAQSLAMGDTQSTMSSLDKVQRQIEKANPPDKTKLLSLIESQRALVEIVRNHKDKAQDLANKAQELDNNSPSAALAQAYVAQSSFNLPQAKKSLEQGLASNPENSFLLARLAEIELGFGKDKKALELLDTALSITPQDPYALTVLGFTMLTRGQIAQAKEKFEQVISLNGSYSLAHLGLGLATLHSGDLAQGRKEIEKAVYLDPNVAVYRSYLGKAFFEEEREGLAGAEYDKAIELDPNDPTPYLYRAYNSLSGNKPVEALRDVETSISKNQNRAVFRSSLLLDQDLGVRSAGLSEVFSNLGFNQAARVEAIKAINRDYSNYSAHRLLADSYNTILLNDANVSENEISSLLAPLSFNLFSRGSSAKASLNEYSSLFDRDQTRTELRFDGSNQDELIAPGVSTAGKSGNVGYYLGFDSTLTDGSKHDNYSRLYKPSVALQYQASPDDLVILGANGVYRKRVDDQAEVDQVEFKDYDINLGYHKRIASDLTLIAHTNFADQRNDFLDLMANRAIELTQEIDGELFSAEDDLLLDESTNERIKSSRTGAQLIYDADRLSLVFGAQMYIADIDREENSLVLDDSLQILSGLDYYLQSTGFNNLNAYDIYAYSTLHLTSWMDFIAGGSFTDLELEQREITPFITDDYQRSHVNPKVGLSLYPTDAFTVRSAYFETLRKSSLEDNAALEPTLVGGINQRFTDLTGARARNLGLGLDYKWAAKTYLGVEGIKRHVIDDVNGALSVVGLDPDGFPITSRTDLLDQFENNQDQNIVRGYIYQVLLDQLIATADYQWSSFERTDTDIYQKIQLNKAGVALRYFHPSGWFSFAGTTWREQDRQGGDFIEDGNNQFWTYDAGLGYRIPKRHGSVILKVTDALNSGFTYDQSLGLEEFVRSDFGVIIQAAFNF